MSKTRPAKSTEILKALATNYKLLKAKPCLLSFLFHYMKKFTVINVGGGLILHSHLPPLNSVGNSI